MTTNFKLAAMVAAWAVLGLGCPYSGDDDDAAGYGGYEDDDNGGDYYGDDDDATGDDDDAGEPGDNEDPPDDVGPPPEDGEDTLCKEAPEEPTTWFVSADDSNSMAQPTLYRMAIESGANIWASPRLYEFLNYYDFDYGAGSGVRLVPQLRETEDGYSFLVGVVGPDRDNDARRPLNLTFSLDLSGSMGGSGMNGMRDAMRVIAGELREGDMVSMVGWSSSTNVLLDSHAITGPDDATFLGIVNSLSSGGSTDLDGGLNRAYALAQQNATSTSINRVVLISDGGANVGNTSATLIGDNAEDQQEDAIYLAAIGTGNIQEAFMDEITDLGKGAYMYVDGLAEAERLLSGDRFLAAFDLAAKNVQLQVTLPEGIVIDVFSGEEISEDPDEVRPQHLAPNDAMLYHFDLVDCMQEASGRQVGLQVTWTEPLTGTQEVATLDVTWDELLVGPTHAVHKADAILRYARLAAGEDLDPQLVQDAANAYPSDTDLQEIAALVQQL